MEEEKKNNTEEEIISDSGSMIADVRDEFRGRRGLKSESTMEGIISDSGSMIADVRDELRGRRGLERERDNYTGIFSDREVAGEYFERGNDFLDIVVIRDKKYRVIKLISDTTAEARIFKVEKDDEEYALKLYYPSKSHKVNKTILQLIKDNEQPGLIKIYDFGTLTNGYNPSEKCEFELMEYCDGGDLQPGSLNGKTEELYYVALGMAIAAISCEFLGFIHRDIKPQNFLWADKEHSRLVLTDFGFAVPCPPGEYVRVEDHRTIIYTAPEFYLRAPGLPSKISASSDLYSVGISMLTLWSGEEVMMGMTETEQIEMKSREQLPYPADMSPFLLELLKGLTSVRPDQRWDFDKIKVWASDNPEKRIQEQLNKEFEIIFDAANNLIANNRDELVGLMIQNPETAIRLLYSGMLDYWIEDAGFFEEAATLHQITEDMYPRKDQHTAGLWYAIFTIVPYTPYFFPNSKFENPEEVITANSTIELTDKIWNIVFVNKNMPLKSLLVDEIMDPYSRLSAYLKWQGQEGKLTAARNLINEEIKIDEGILLLLYGLNPTLPIYLEGKTAETLSDIISKVHENGNKPFKIFTNKAFVEWLSFIDPFLSIDVENIILNGGNGNDVYAALFNASLNNWNNS